MNNSSRYIGLILLLLLMCTFFAFAQSDTSTSSKTSTGLFGLVIAYYICNSMKRRAIGGWLLYFYMQLYGGALILLVAVLSHLKNFDAASWDDRTLYTLYLLTTIPAHIMALAEVIVGSMLLLHRFKIPQTVKWLRIILVVSFVIALVGLVIDYEYWPESVALDFLPLIASILWFFYFTQSIRVSMVFKQANWDPNMLYPFSPGSSETGDDKSNVTKRILYVIGSILVVIVCVFLVVYALKL